MISNKSTNTLLLFIFLLISGTLSAQEIGDTGWVFDDSKYDTRIPAMQEWAKAGVEGGIPYRDSIAVKETLTADSTNQDMAPEIQAAIDKVASQSGGVVLLKKGTYHIKSAIVMKSNVILRGESRESTIIESTMRVIADPDNAKLYDEGKIKFGKLDNGLKWRKPTILFDDVQKAALEDFTMVYRVWYEDEEVFPTDTDYDLNTKITTARRQTSFHENRYVYPSSASYNFSYDNPVKHDMFATFVKIDGADSKNLWIDNCSFLRSGTDHIFINAGSHITIRNTEINGAFQKAGQGNGYGINSYGTYVLMVKCDVRKVRHWAIQKGAMYNVIYDSYSEVDINFHQDDLGSNIVENTKIVIPQYHAWKNPFQVGAAYHRPPGKSNFFYNNDVAVIDDNLQANKKFADDKIYTFIDKAVKVSELESPEHGALYAVKRFDPADLIVNGVSLTPDSIILETGQTKIISATVTPVSATNKGVTWTSSDTLIATVNPNGLVTAIAKGETSITATTSDGGYTATCHVQIIKYTNSTPNVARDKKASASSEPEPENGASKAVDGKNDTRWSAENFPQSIEIDLGEEFNINKTELVCYQDRAYRFLVEAKEDDESSYTVLVDRSRNTHPGAADKPITDYFSEFKARHVKLTVTGASAYDGSWISISEFRVFGDTLSNQSSTKDIYKQASVNAYPNPFTSKLTIDLKENDFQTLKIIDLSGRVLVTQEISDTNNIELSLSHSKVPAGNYMLQLVGENHITTQKLTRR